MAARALKTVAIASTAASLFYLSLTQRTTPSVIGVSSIEGRRVHLQQVQVLFRHGARRNWNRLFLLLVLTHASSAQAHLSTPYLERRLRLQSGPSLCATSLMTE
jgi:hypothetical protein